MSLVELGLEWISALRMVVGESPGRFEERSRSSESDSPNSTDNPAPPPPSGQTQRHYRTVQHTPPDSIVNPKPTVNTISQRSRRNMRDLSQRAEYSTTHKDIFMTSKAPPFITSSLGSEFSAIFISNCRNFSKII